MILSLLSFQDKVLSILLTIIPYYNRKYFLALIKSCTINNIIKIIMEENSKNEIRTPLPPQRIDPLAPPHNEKEPVKGMIFDMDGTVVNSIENDYKAWKKVFKEHGVDFPYEDLVMKSGTKGTELVKKYLDLPEKELESIVRKKNEYFFEISAQDGLEMMPHVQELLTKVKEYSYRTALATGGNRDKANFILKHINLEGYFDEIVTADDLSKGKPDPEIFLKAAEKLGVNPEETLVWEDAPFGVEAAKNGNFKCVAITTSQKGNSKGLERADKLIDSFEGLILEDIIEELLIS